MILHPCPRCKQFIPVGVQYCDSCRPQAEQQAAEAMERRRAFKRKAYNRQYNKNRDKKYQTFYCSKDWRTLSRTKLQQAKYKCEAGLEGCRRLAVEVHHKQPIQTDEGWEHRLDWDNLEALCINCHNKRRSGGRVKADPGVIDLRKLDR